MQNLETPPLSANVDTTLVKGFRILETLVASSDPLGISSLSTHLGLGKSNVHRLLSTLIELGFVKQDPDTKRYLPTYKCWELGSFVVERDLVRRNARSIMKELLVQTGESVVLAILSGTEIVYLDKVEGEGTVQSSSRNGSRVPALLPSSGKLLIALQPSFEGLVDKALEDLPEGYSLNRADIIDELATIRSQRYAISLGGWTRGVNAISVPIGPELLPPVAALGLAISPERWTEKHVSRCLDALRKAASRIADAVNADPAQG